VRGSLFGSAIDLANSKSVAVYGRRSKAFLNSLVTDSGYSSPTTDAPSTFTAAPER
jgi:hypothetical protein